MIKILVVLIMALILGFVAQDSFATGSIIDLSSVEVDTDMVGVLGATVITALAGLWGVRKVVKFINRS